MSTKTEDNFNKLVTKAMNQMSTVRGMPADVQTLAKEGENQSKKGFDFFKKWFKSLEYDDKSVLAGEIEHYTKQRKRTVQAMLGVKYESKELKSFKEITEVSTKGVTFSFGRFNPPTVGHVKLATKMKSVSKAHDVKIYTSHTTGDAKNPLTNAQIRKFMNPMLPRGINVSDIKARTIFDVVVDFSDLLFWFSCLSKDRLHY